MAHRISISAFQGFKDIEGFYALLMNSLNDERALNLHLDLSAVTFVIPEVLLAILCAARVWHRTKRTKINIQFHQDVLLYIERTGYFTAAKDFILTTQPISDKWSKSGSYNLLEITPIPFEIEANDRAVYETYPRIEDILRYSRQESLIILKSIKRQLNLYSLA